MAGRTATPRRADARSDDPYARLEGNGVYNLTGFFLKGRPGRHWMATVVLRF